MTGIRMPTTKNVLNISAVRTQCTGCCELVRFSSGKWGKGKIRFLWAMESRGLLSVNFVHRLISVHFLRVCLFFGEGLVAYSFQFSFDKIIFFPAVCFPRASEVISSDRCHMHSICFRQFTDAFLPAIIDCYSYMYFCFTLCATCSERCVQLYRASHWWKPYQSINCRATFLFRLWQS